MLYKLLLLCQIGGGRWREAAGTNPSTRLSRFEAPLGQKSRLGSRRWVSESLMHGLGASKVFFRWIVEELELAMWLAFIYIEIRSNDNNKDTVLIQSKPANGSGRETRKTKKHILTKLKVSFPCQGRSKTAHILLHTRQHLCRRALSDLRSGTKWKPSPTCHPKTPTGPFATQGVIATLRRVLN